MAGLLGNIFGALGKNQAPDIQSRPLSQIAEPLYNKLFADYEKLGTAASGDLDKFREQYSSLTPQLSQLDQLHSSLYGDLLNKASSYDPTVNLRTSGDYLFGNLNKYLDRGALEANSALVKQRLALGGGGDQMPGGYAARLNADRITSNLLPAFSGIVNALPSLSAQQNSDYFRNLAAFPQLAQLQSASLENAPLRTLVPSLKERENLLANLNALNQINAGNLSNRYFYEKPNWMTTVGDVASGAYQGIGDALDLVNKAASTYSNVLGGGMIGGLGGQKPPDLNGGSNLNTGQFPGESLQSMGVTQIGPSGYSVGGQYGPLGIGGYSQYNPSSALGGHQPLVANPGAYQMPSVYGGQLPGPNYGNYSPYGVYGSQNPYGQYGAFFQ